MVAEFGVGFGRLGIPYGIYVLTIHPQSTNHSHVLLYRSNNHLTYSHVPPTLPPRRLATHYRSYILIPLFVPTLIRRQIQYTLTTMTETPATPTECIDPNPLNPHTIRFRDRLMWALRSSDHMSVADITIAISDGGLGEQDVGTDTALLCGVLLRNWNTHVSAKSACRSVSLALGRAIASTAVALGKMAAVSAFVAGVAELHHMSGLKYHDGQGLAGKYGRSSTTNRLHVAL